MRHRAVFWLAGAAGVAGLALLAFWTPRNSPALTVCVTRNVLGLPCPGCGMTRALAHLLHGDLARALALHPLVPLAAADVVAAYAVWGVSLHGLATPPSARTVRTIVLVQLALFLALWLGRLASGTLPY